MTAGPPTSARNPTYTPTCQMCVLVFTYTHPQTASAGHPSCSQTVTENTWICPGGITLGRLSNSARPTTLPEKTHSAHHTQCSAKLQLAFSRLADTAASWRRTYEGQLHPCADTGSPKSLKASPHTCHRKKENKGDSVIYNLSNR